jgi:cyclopropane fatty-acyl-phospholipid synthase-like methyltransferase
MASNTDVPKDHESVGCNLCGDTGGTVVVDETRKIRTPQGDFEFYVHDVCCENCGLVYWTPRLVPERLHQYYEAVYRAPVQEDGLGDSRRRQIRSRMDLLSEHVKPGALLEIGAGEGFFLERAAEVGFQATGLEPSVEYAQVAQRVAPTAHVVATFLEDYRAPAEYDIVCSFYVLEHSLDAADFLRRCHSLLKPGGSLYLEVPDIGRYPEQTGDMLWHEHTYHFGQRSLKRLLERAGFEVGYVSSPGPSYPFGMAIIASRLPRPTARWDRDLPDRTAHDEAVRGFRGHAETVKRYRRALYDSLGPLLADVRAGKKRLAVYGSGVFFDSLFVYAGLRISDVALLVDDNQGKWGTRSTQGLEVKPPQRLKESPVEVVVVASDAFEAQLVARVQALNESLANRLSIVRPHSDALAAIEHREDRPAG